MAESLEYFTNINYDIVFCTCRTRGSTVDIIESYNKIGNDIKYIKQNLVKTKFKENNINMANSLIKTVELFIDIYFKWFRMYMPLITAW